MIAGSGRHGRFTPGTRVLITIGLAVLIGTSASAAPLEPREHFAQGAADVRERLRQAMIVFSSDHQPDSIPMFTQLIDDLRAQPRRDQEANQVLAQSLLYRAQARLNVDQVPGMEADLRAIAEVLPTFQIADTGLSAQLIRRYGEINPPVGYLRINISPVDAQVQVGPKAVDARRGPISTPAGATTVSAHREGFVDESLTVNVAVGQTVPVEIKMQRIPRPPRGLILPRRVTFAVNRGYHISLEQSSSTYRYFVYRENATADTTYKMLRGLKHYDVGGAVRVWGGLAVGFNHSILETGSVGALATGVPHPTILNSPRALAADVQGLSREEHVLHIEIRAAGGSRRFEGAAFVGPSIFDVRQTIVSNFTFQDFTSRVTFLSASQLEERKDSVLGFHLGVEGAAMIIPYVGFGGFARYSHASSPFEDGRQTGTLISGGFQTGGGLRFRF